jgi:hypothetical protein|tara:strand:- start:711 stop:914 length:204 start_codon:yes stop_codon:yes gene_type:complete
MNPNELKQFVEMMRGCGVGEFEFTREGFDVKVKFLPEKMIRHDDLDDLVVTDSKELSQDDLLFYSSE